MGIIIYVMSFNGSLKTKPMAAQIYANIWYNRKGFQCGKWLENSKPSTIYYFLGPKRHSNIRSFVT